MDLREKPLLCPFMFLITCIPVQPTSSQCLGSNCCGLGCCAGFMLDMNSSSCIPCGTGYIGKHCDIPCPFPMFGDGCQFRCECNYSSCSHSVGCRPAITTLRDDRIPTNQYEFTSLFLTPLTAESKIKVTTETVKILNVTVTERAMVESDHSTKRSFYSFFPERNTKRTPKTDEKDGVALSLNANSPLLIGIFTFNAFFVVIVFTVVLYCGCRKYRKYRKRKKDNSATVIHYHEIDDNIAGPSVDYDPLYTTDVTEIVDKPQATEMKNFLVEYENEPLNRERKSMIDLENQKRRSDTSPKQVAHQSDSISERTSEGNYTGEKRCTDVM